jgi:hypothetical protein
MNELSHEQPASARATVRATAPRLTSAERLGHALRVRIPKLAVAVVAEQYRRRPQLADRYGPAGRAHCVKDTTHTLRFLAESVSFAEPRIFCDYSAWALAVMARHGVAAEDVGDNFRLLAELLPRHLPPEAAAAAGEHVRAALHGLRASSR